MSATITKRGDVPYASRADQQEDTTAVQDLSPSINDSNARTRLVLAVLGVCIGFGTASLLGQATSTPASVLAVATILAFAGGLLSTWSPCGYSSLSLLRPHGYYSASSVAEWLPTLFAHALGYLFGVVVLGGALGLCAWLLPLPALESWPLLVVGALAIGYGLHSFGLLSMPYPERCIQVSHGARNRHAMWKIGWAYGVQLGLNFVTYVRSPILYIVVALTLISGSITTAMILIAALNLGRWVPLLVNALPLRDQAIQGWLASNEQNARFADGIMLAAAGTAFIYFGLV